MHGRVRLAVVGAIAVAVFAAALAGQSWGAAQGQSPAGSPRMASATHTPDTAVGDDATPSATTARPTPRPTQPPQPRPTPTRPPVGVTVQIEGNITSTPDTTTRSFQLHYYGGSFTVVVASNATISGQATTFAGLQRGWEALITGAFQENGSFLATAVSAHLDR